MRKVAIVTGGTSGIGLAAVNALREKGCTVYALSRHGDIPCDVADETSAKAAVQTVLAKEGRIDALVNCAGFGISGAAELTPLDTAKRQLDVNLFGTANMVNAVIPAMRKQGGGRIVNTGSVAGFVPIPFQTWYSASKAAVQAYTMAMGNELRPFGITLTAVLPGDTRTGFTAARQKIDDPENLYQGRIARSVQRMEQVYAHAFACDQHRPFTCPGVREFVDWIDPEYLTFEFISRSRAEQEAMLREQIAALE